MNENYLIKTLQDTIKLQKDTIESQNKIIESLREEIRKANENIEYLIKKLYGRKTEKTAVIDGQLVINDISLGLFNETEKETDSSVLEPVPFEEPVKKQEKVTREKKLLIIFHNRTMSTSWMNLKECVQLMVRNFQY